MVDKRLEFPPVKGDEVPMLKNLIKRTEQEIAEAEIDLKKLLVLKKEVAVLKENLGEWDE